MKKYKKIMSLIMLAVMMMTITNVAYAQEIMSGGTQSYSANSNDTTDFNLINFSVLENPHIFASVPDGFERTWVKPSEKEGTADKVDFYGVVMGNRYINDHSIYFIEMNSNVQGLVSSGTSYKMEKLFWSIETTKGDTIITDWSPSGTTTTTTGGQKIDVIINPSYKGISVGSIGTSFTINQKNDTVKGFSSSISYDTSWETNSPLPSETPQDLRSMVSYYLGGDSEWEWLWQWHYSW